MTQLEASRLDKMEEKLDELSEDVKDILVSIKGSELTGKGLKGRVDDIDSRVKALERYVIMGAGVLATITFIYGIIQLLKQ